MKKSDLGQTIGILANLGVLVGLVVLILELQQTNRIAEEQAEYASLLESLRMNEIVIQEDNALLFYRSATDTPLSPLDQQRRSTLIGGMFEQWQWIFARRPEQLPTASFRATWRRSEAQDVWEERKGEYLPEFVQWLEREVATQ